MEPSGAVRSLSQIQAFVSSLRQKPRPGQLAVFEALESCGRKMNIKLPTGYGKTYTAMGVYSILRSLGECNRMLVIFPTDAQLLQFESQIPRSWSLYAVDGPCRVVDIRISGPAAIRAHQRGECQIFGITVQSLLGERGFNAAQALTGKGRWLVVVDEYHHYGIDKPYGEAVTRLPYEFMLCMSATPYRPDNDSAFGEPAVSVSYRDAVKQGAVKELCAHSYHYRIDMNIDGEIVSYSTEELAKEAGGSDPNAIEQLTIKRNMRWSAKYISPLVSTPLHRLARERVSKHSKLQAIVGAMCVSHAQAVCDQIRAMFPEYTTEWVGTGTNGRSKESNNEILSRFAPSDGSDPEIDVLVHVGMAGEGLDTVTVSEVIHLNAAGVNNTNNQENGRAARYLPGVIGHINFDASSGYAKAGYVGRKIMDAMDCLPPSDDEEDEQREGSTASDEWQPLPEEPNIRIIDVECIHIDDGDERVAAVMDFIKERNVSGYHRSELEDPDSALFKDAMRVVRQAEQDKAMAINSRNTIRQWQDQLNSALSGVAGHVVQTMKRNGARIERSLVGDIKKRINSRKKYDLGPVDADIETLTKHYQWLQRLDKSIHETGEIPTWLS